ncbi:unnamed protein product [Oikopleura dioica]|uniref:N-acetyltransferase domain-containing protein n=1 Tax=Oikopleura dioica TaxID=34765 RepID=E4WW53_OIKDI|nr:unnamed protein product [Oikopleura dioica]
MIEVREFQRKDQDAAFAIWKHGMSVDLGNYWIQWILNQNHVRLMILLVPVLVYHLGYASSLIQGIFFSTLPSGILVAFLRFMVYRTNKDYVNTRTDMLDIEKHHGKRFLVAEGDKGEILGTIVYVEEPKITYFKENKIEGKCWEMFSMSVKHSARRLGVAHKMLGDLERRAREANVEAIVFDASTPQIPAVKFYKKFGYDWELVPFPSLGNSFPKKQIANCFFKFCRMDIIKFHKRL